jgi:hypothetical protein
VLTKKNVLRLLALAAVAVPTSAHAVHARLEERRAEQEIGRLLAAIPPLEAMASDGAQRIALNGASVFLRKSTEARSVDDVLAAVAKECASGDAELALEGRASNDQAASKTIKLERIVAQASDDGAARASLCIFERDRADQEPRVRYTVAERVDDHTTRITSVVNASATPLAELFPAEGDSPGSDIAGIARPERSRRTLTAIASSDEHSVRIYESPLPVPDAVRSYDAAMSNLGYVATASLPDARMYRRDGRSYAVSFNGNSDGSSVTIAPFDDDGAASRR